MATQWVPQAYRIQITDLQLIALFHIGCCRMQDLNCACGEQTMQAYTPISAIKSSKYIVSGLIMSSAERHDA
jgi:hypothetical protein